MDVKKREWKPAPEAENRGGWGGFIGRNVGLVGGVLVLYFAFSLVTGYVFRPNYQILAVVGAEEVVEAGRPLRIGLSVRNDRWKEGAAYVVLAIEGETEIEGPVTRVPSREGAEVMLSANLAPGWRTGTLILYDAVRENVRVAAKHGVLVRVGKPGLEVLAADFPARIAAGETLVFRIRVSNESGQVPVRFVPMALLTPDVSEAAGGAAKPRARERTGRSHWLEPGAESDAVRLEVRTGDLEPGPYFVNVTMTDPGSGRRIGKGKYRMPLRVTE